MTQPFGRYQIDAGRPWVMGVLNLTPDSFSDGGLVAGVDHAVARAEALKQQGADILDIGGESTRPGAKAVSPEEEAHRVLPVLKALQDLGLPLSLDSRRPAVVAAALDIGIDMVNDITGFRNPHMQALLPNIQKAGCAVCVMHMQGEPQTMQQAPFYTDVVAEVFGFLRSRQQDLIDYGFRTDQVYLDPGFGFGKTLAHNQALMRALLSLAHHHQVLVGLSRKSMIGALLGRSTEPQQRLAGSLSAALCAAQQGARILRVHDVQETVDALRVWRELR
ncbi:MAG: dihydropteroate synthase [Burkholderiaceae bacterium]